MPTQTSGMLSQPVISSATQNYPLSNHESHNAISAAGGVRTAHKNAQPNYTSDYQNNIFRPNTSSGASALQTGVHQRARSMVGTANRGQIKNMTVRRNQGARNQELVTQVGQMNQLLAMKQRQRGNRTNYVSGTGFSASSAYNF
jgi:hypothetical protein